jgi:uncharacterized membrane protein
MTTPETPPPVGTTEDRTVAILSYITIIGFIIAIVLHSSKKTALGAYHLRQCLGLFVTAVVGGFCMIIPLLNVLLIPVLGIGLFVLWILGLIAAVNGQQKPMPLVGEYYQKWFAGAFA